MLLAPFPLVVPEEPLAREKLCPVLGLVRVADARRGIDAARAMVRIGGAGHSAVIHSTIRARSWPSAPRCDVLRVAVNAGSSTGTSGFDTNLAPSMTIGTGFFGRSSIGENLEPRHLVNWTRVAYADVRRCRSARSRASSRGAPSPSWCRARRAHPREPPNGNGDEMREEIRRLVVEELRELMRR